MFRFPGGDAVFDDDRLAMATAYTEAMRNGDAGALAALSEPDAVVWHNFDGRLVDREESNRTEAWLRRTVPDITWEDVAVHVTAGGFVWQAIITGTAPGGPLRVHTCMVVTLSGGGRVARIDEYLDPAQLGPLTDRDRGLSEVDQTGR